jgi:hypothetical protein
VRRQQESLSGWDTKVRLLWRAECPLWVKSTYAVQKGMSVGGRAVITMAGAITMPRSWSLRRNIITTIDVFWLSDESKNPAWWPDFLLLVGWNKLPL